MWPYAALLSFLCFFLTYALQIVTQNFCANSCSYAAYIIQKILFVVGLSTTNGFTLWREIYFYFFMLLVTMTERYLLDFTQRELTADRSRSQPPTSQKPVTTLLNIREEEDDEEDSSNRLKRPTAEEQQLFETTVHNVSVRNL